MSSASATSSSSTSSNGEAPQPSLGLVEDITRKFAKIQGLSLLSVLGMLEDDDDYLRDRNRRVTDSLLGSNPATEQGEDMNSRRTILADNITFNVSDKAPVAAPPPPSSNNTVAKVGAAVLGTAALLGLGYGIAKVSEPDPVEQVVPSDPKFKDRSSTIRFFD